MTSLRAWSRRRALSAVGASLIAPGAAAQPEAPAPGTPPPSSETPTTPPTDSGAFLETAFDKAVRLTVPVWLNGKGPFDFVIDTGANRTVVCEDVAAELHLPTAGTAPVHGIVSAETAPMVKVSRLRVGEVVSADMSLPVVPRNRLGAAGLLGLDAMHGRRMRMGFRDRKFEIEPSGGVGLSRGGNSRVRSPYAPVTVPARYRDGQLVILDAEAAGKPITAFLDSGSQVTVGNRVLRDLVFAARPVLAQQVVRSELVSATGQHTIAEFAPLADLRLGGQRFSSPLAAFADLHIFELWNLKAVPTVLVGVDVMRRFDSVGFDFVQKTVTFWPARPGRE